MPAMRVVEALDEVEHGEARLDLRAEAGPIEELALERGEETLTQRVVVAIADRAHRGGHPTSLHRRPKAIEVYCVPWSEW